MDYKTVVSKNCEGLLRGLRTKFPCSHGSSSIVKYIKFILTERHQCKKLDLDSPQFVGGNILLCLNVDGFFIF